MEMGHYLKTALQLLDAPDIKKAFDANTEWDAVEIGSNRYQRHRRTLAARQDGGERAPILQPRS
jgi:hypothetical protein